MGARRGALRLLLPPLEPEPPVLSSVTTGWSTEIVATWWYAAAKPRWVFVSSTRVRLWSAVWQRIPNAVKVYWLETELLNRTSLRTRHEARSAVFDYIEGFYNPIRRHSAPRLPLTCQLRKEHTHHPKLPSKPESTDGLGG